MSKRKPRKKKPTSDFDGEAEHEDVHLRRGASDERQGQVYHEQSGHDRCCDTDGKDEELA